MSSKRRDQKRQKKFEATKAKALANFADEQVDLFKTDITFRIEERKRKKEGRI